MVSGLTLRSLVHFELIFVSCVDRGPSFLRLSNIPSALNENSHRGEKIQCHVRLFNFLAVSVLS